MNVNHLKKIDAIMDEMIASGFASGASTVVFENGKEVYYNEVGFIDIEGKKLHKRDSIFRLYSMSKPITAACAMAAVEDGLLDLNLNVSDFIKEFKNQVYEENGELKPVHREMKVKDLINMTGGLSYGGDANENQRQTSKLTEEGINRLDTDNEMTTLEFARRMGEIPLQFSPGESFNYSYCADILGAVIEVVTGKKFGDYMRERILEPLEMYDTGFYVPKEKQDRLAKVYAQTQDGLKEYHYNNLLINLKMEHEPGFQSGGAGLCSTLDDYSHFAKMLLNKGEYKGKQVLQQGTVRYFTEATAEDGGPQEAIKYWDGMNGFTYANLLRIMKEPGKSMTECSKGEYGWDGWLGPYFINDPAHNITILHMLQRTDSGTTSFMRRIRNVVYAAVEE